MLCPFCEPQNPCDKCIERIKLLELARRDKLKYCINCKYIGLDHSRERTGDPEYDSVCMHNLAKRGDPSMIMGVQTRITCYNMRKNGDCGLDAKLYVEKPRDKVHE